MPIVQISRIQHRKGLLEDLPQLSSAELAWAVDEQRLFIGNGSLSEGAPYLGNTELLTEHSDLLQSASPYTFKGNSEMGEISGGTPYGATTLAGNDGSRMPSENELAGARFQGNHVAQIAGKLIA